MDNIIGMLARDWLNLLKENRFNISPVNWLKAAYITQRTVRNSSQKKHEDRLYAKAIEDARIEQPPVFIIGHWRSGTTFLHSLLAIDKQFAFPNLFEAMNPYTFLQRQPLYERRLKQYGAHKRRMDNVHVALDSPIEEEFIVAVLSQKSPLIGWTFPKNRAHYDRFLTFREASELDKKRWQDAMDFLLRKLTFKYKKPLLLKSPTNTCKISMLLSMYPKAKFIHIKRNPYRVFTSTQNLYRTAVKASAMQKSNRINLDEYILAQYRKLYDVYFEEQPQIPLRQFAEVVYEELEANPIQIIQKVYEQLDLKLDAQTGENLKAYLSENSGYKKNSYQSLPPEIRDQIYQNWRRNFETWNYPK
jgi:hypothetical protein